MSYPFAPSNSFPNLNNNHHNNLGQLFIRPPVTPAKLSNPILPGSTGPLCQPTVPLHSHSGSIPSSSYGTTSTNVSPTLGIHIPSDASSVQSSDSGRVIPPTLLPPKLPFSYDCVPSVYSNNTFSGLQPHQITNGVGIASQSNHANNFYRAHDSNPTGNGSLLQLSCPASVLARPPPYPAPVLRRNVVSSPPESNLGWATNGRCTQSTIQNPYVTPSRFSSANLLYSAYTIQNPGYFNNNGNLHPNASFSVGMPTSQWGARLTSPLQAQLSNHSTSSAGSFSASGVQHSDFNEQEVLTASTSVSTFRSDLSSSPQSPPLPLQMFQPQHTPVAQRASLPAQSSSHRPPIPPKPITSQLQFQFSHLSGSQQQQQQQQQHLLPTAPAPPLQPTPVVTPPQHQSRVLARSGSLTRVPGRRISASSGGTGAGASNASTTGSSAVGGSTAARQSSTLGMLFRGNPSPSPTRARDRVKSLSGGARLGDSDAELNFLQLDPDVVAVCDCHKSIIYD